MHWLPVRQRIEFKILVLVFKSLIGQAPQYLNEMIELYVPTRKLRSTDQRLLTERKAKLESGGGRAFSVVAPKLWNSMPVNLRFYTTLESFKTALKTYLFRKAFSQ